MTPTQAQETGGAAFPVVFEKEDYIHDGITMRDYFAAKALAMKFGPRTTTMPLDEMATLCYLMADAMMEARK